MALMDFLPKRLQKLIGNIILLILGIAIIIVAGIVKNIDSKIDYLETEATIVKIVEETTYDSDGAHTDYTVYVNYTVDGKDYENRELGSYSASMKEGDTITINYNADNPAEIQGEGFDTMIWVFIGLGALLVIVSLAGTARLLMRGR